MRNAFYIGLVKLHIGAKGYGREQRDFVRGIYAFNVKSGVGFGVAQALCFFEHVGKVQPFIAHFAQDEVGSAVDDACNPLNAVGAQAFAQSLDDGYAASNSRFKSHHNAFLLRCLEDFCAMHGQQCLVGRNDVLAVFNGFEHQLFCHGVATNQLYNHVNIGARYGGKSIVYDFYSIASNRFCVCQITVCHQHNFYAPPHAGADFCLIAAQYVKYARANGANA